MQKEQYNTIIQDMKDALQRSPPHQVNLTANQSAATSTVSVAALSKLHLDGNSSPEKKKKFLTELFHALVEVVPDNKFDEVTAKLMDLPDFISDTKSTDWSFSISPTNASDNISQIFFVPEGDLVDLDESEDFVPKDYISNLHVPKLAYLMLRLYSNLKPKNHKAYFASMHDLSLKTHYPSTETDERDGANHELSQDVKSGSSENDQVEGDNKDREKEELAEEMKQAVESLKRNLEEELGEHQYEQSDLSYVLIPISVCKYCDRHSCILMFRTSSILISTATQAGYNAYKTICDDQASSNTDSIDGAGNIMTYTNLYQFQNIHV